MHAMHVAFLKIVDGIKIHLLPLVYRFVFKMFKIVGGPKFLSHTVERKRAKRRERRKRKVEGSSKQQWRKFASVAFRERMLLNCGNRTF